MSIRIDTLRAAADLGAARLQAGGNEQLVGDARRAGFFDFALRRTINAENRATAAMIKEALCAHYGRVRGERLFNRHVGEKGKDLSSVKLRALLLEGDGEITNKAGLVRESVLRRIAMLPNSGPLDGAVLRSVDMVVSSFVRANDVLSQEPLNLPEISQALADVRGEIAKIDELLQELGNLPAAQGAFALQTRIAVQDLRAQLQHQEGLLLQRLLSCPITNGNVNHAIGLMHDAAISFVDDLIARNEVEGNLARLQALRDSLVERKQAALGGNVEPHAKAADARIKMLKNTPDKLGKLVASAVQGMRFTLPAGGGTCSYSAKKIGKMISTAHCGVLNGQAWTTIRREVKACGRTFVSELRPATVLNPSFERTYGGHGVCCHSTTERVHAVNLAQTELKLPGQGQPIFKALRHGVHCAYGLAGIEEREAANDARVNEMLLASLCDKPDLLARALAGEEVSLPITSVSLLTPDGLRSGSDDNETKYLLEQSQAWRRASQGPRQISVVDADGVLRQVTVRPQVILFNFGVNAGAQGRVQGFVGGWFYSDILNRRAMEALLGGTGADTLLGGVVGDFLKRPDVTGQQVHQILDLVRQIKELWNNETYRTRETNPYLLPARLLVLAGMTGQMPAFNCKSGKDRTGQLDVEAKVLVAQIHLLGRVPTLEESASEEYKEIREQVSINGGNHEMQRLNTGLAGFKTKGVSGLRAVYRGKTFTAALGLSEYVHS